MRQPPLSWGGDGETGIRYNLCSVIVNWRELNAMRKEKLQQVLSAMPEEVDLDAFMEKLYLMRKIELAEEQLRKGQGIPHDEARERLQRWLA